MGLHGQAAVGLASVFDRVIATDASEKQIANAQSHERVEYRIAPAENSGVGSELIDLIMVAQALHWFDLDRFYAEARRVLKPDGFGVVLVPLVSGVEETHEDPAIDTPALRWKHYGLDDHVRQYGKRDFVDRLTGAGFTVDQLGKDHFGRAAFKEAGITEKSVLYVVRHSAG